MYRSIGPISTQSLRCWQYCIRWIVINWKICRSHGSNHSFVTVHTIHQFSKPKPKFNITIIYDFSSITCVETNSQTKSEFPFHIDRSVWVMLLIYFTRCFGHNHCATVGNANDDSFEAQTIIRECEIYSMEMIHNGWRLHDMGYIFDLWCFVFPIHNVVKIKIKSKRIFIKRTKFTFFFFTFQHLMRKRYLWKFVHMKVNFLRWSYIVCRRHTEHSCVYFLAHSTLLH